MTGKKGRSGRPKGSLSWSKNPVGRAGHHLNALIEMWLAGLPLVLNGVRLPVAVSGTTRTVPPGVKRKLVRIAIDHMHEIYGGPMPDEKQVDYWSRRKAPTSTLRAKKAHD